MSRGILAPRPWPPAIRPPRRRRETARSCTGPPIPRATELFLFATTAEQLAYLRFPLGALPKPAVRAAAAELGLAVADKPDSQDICFVPEGRYTTVIDRLRPHGAEPGDIVHLDGRRAGPPRGRHPLHHRPAPGLNVAVGDPLFVVRIDAASRQVIVGPREALLTHALTLKEMNWIGDGPSFEAACDAGRPVLARVRSTREPRPAAWASSTAGRQ